MAQSLSKKHVLEEDEYVEAMDKIIERDFFPDLQKLKSHSKWLDALASNNPTKIEEARQSLLNQKFNETASRRSSNPESKPKHRTPISIPTSSWDQPTPPRDSSDLPSSPCINDASISEKSDTRVDDPTAMMTLNKFIANHTSEDNAAFEEIQEKDIVDHKRKYHWAFDDSHGRGDAKHHLLTDGTWISQERRQLMDKACETKLAIEDSRPNAPDTWKFRTRNPLLFPPDLDTNRDICKVRQYPAMEQRNNVRSQLPAETATSSNGDILLLENGVKKQPSSALINRTRTGAAPKKPMETVYANSRFSSSFLSSQDAIPEQMDINDHTKQEKPKDLVSMTPMLIPGVDASPMITWGSIGATPMIIRDDSPLPTSNRGPSFVIKDTSSREKLAHEMDARNKQRMKARSTPTPLFSKKYTPTPLKSTLRTPGVFGGDMQLRASYSTPLRCPPMPSSKK